MNAETDLDRPHVFLLAEEDSAASPLLLLHGTGGNEYDLLPLAIMSRQVRRCSRYVGQSWRTGCRGSSVGSVRECSTRTAIRN